jgi:tetratricopeptide (TPR) repeat protein
MGAVSPSSKPLELQPMDAPSRVDGAGGRSSAAGLPEESGRSKVSDKLIAEATKEFDEGMVNQPLWMRMLVKHGGDKAAAKTAYLRARAAELRVAHREGAPDGSIRLAREFLNSESARVGSVSVAPATLKQAKQSHARETKRSPIKDILAPIVAKNRWSLAGVVAILALIIIVAVWLLVRRDAGSVSPNVARSEAPTAARAAPAQANPAQAAGKASPSAGDPEVRSPESRLQELADAGNWNVFVLYAVDWTRKAPGNANAWTQLSIGYGKLRQFKDAVDAASKAAQLTPGNAAAWRSLAQANLAANDAAAALVAFEQAAALDATDISSLVQAGMLNAKLDRLPQAQIAFDKALAASPDNVEALCGATAVLQKQGRPKDAETFAKRLASLDAKCRDAGDPASVTVRLPASRSAQPAAR